MKSDNSTIDLSKHTLFTPIYCNKIFSFEGSTPYDYRVIISNNFSTPIAHVYHQTNTKDESYAEANAALIVKAVNNLPLVKDLLSRIVGSMALERVERFDLNEEAKQLIDQLK